MNSVSNSIIRKGVRTMLIIFSVLFIFILILAGTLLAYSPGKVRSVPDKDGKPACRKYF